MKNSSFFFVNFEPTSYSAFFLLSKTLLRLSLSFRMGELLCCVLRSLAWTCRWVYEDDLVGSHNWTLLIDVLDSPLTEAFLRLSGKDNDFGAGGSSLSLQGSVLAPSGPFAVHLVIPSPPDSPLVQKSHSPDLDTSSWRPSTRAAQIGDILLCFFDENNLQLLYEKFNVSLSL